MSIGQWISLFFINSAFKHMHLYNAAKGKIVIESRNRVGLRGNNSIGVFITHNYLSNQDFML